MKKYAWIAVASFSLGLLLAGYLFVHRSETNPATAPLLANVPATDIVPALAAAPAQENRGDMDFAKISEMVGPSVVKIVSEHKVKPRGNEEPWPGGDDFWDRFFGNPSPKNEDLRTMVQGTGFFITSDGYILTNNHIVEGSILNTVYTIQGRDYKAKVIGTDPNTDLALLKIDIKDSPYVGLGDSARVRVGEWVLAIGNPLGMEHTVTAGIVSAKGRFLGSDQKVQAFQDFIQTDAAINRGNSGGPLVNMKGEVIGINSNILSPTGGNIGIGFAIPSNIAKKIVGQLKEKGKVTRGHLGVEIIPVNEGIRKQLGLKDNKGALISSVVPDSPAERAGFKRYDVITEINNQPVGTPNDLLFQIADMQPGKKIQIKVVRDGKGIVLTPIVEELESKETKEKATSPQKDVGMSVIAMTPELAKRHGFGTTEGLLITEVKDYSEADRAGIGVGDIIMEINKKKALSVRDLEKALNAAEEGEDIILLIRREGDGQSQDSIVTLRVP